MTTYRSLWLITLAVVLSLQLVSGCGKAPPPETRFGWDMKRDGPPSNPQLIVKLKDDVEFAWSRNGFFVDDLSGITDFLAQNKQDPHLYPLFHRLALAFQDSFGLQVADDHTTKGDGFDHRLVRFFYVITSSPDAARFIGDSLSTNPFVESVYPRPRIGPAAGSSDFEVCSCPYVDWAGRWTDDSELVNLDALRIRMLSEDGSEAQYATDNFSGANGSFGASDAVDVMVVDYYLYEAHPQLDIPTVWPTEFVSADTVDEHGTLVMGVLASEPQESSDGLQGLQGLAPGADYLFSPLVVMTEDLECLGDGTPSRPYAGLDDGDLSIDCALDYAYANLGSGDVLHIPLADMTYENCYPDTECLFAEDSPYCGDGFALLPVNATPGYNLMLQSIAANGVAVVLAAGNSALDLSATSYPPGAPGATCPGGGYYEPTGVTYPWSVECPTEDGADCTSILVGAGKIDEGLPDSKSVCSNFGSRVDCRGWGDSVASLNFSNLNCEDPDTGDEYTRRHCWTGDFGQTSAASTIVAGIITVTQSMRQAAGLPALTPSEMRSLLRDSANGTAQSPLDAEICSVGPRPDLKNILASEYFPSDLYIRDSLSDDDAVTPAPVDARWRAQEFISPDLVLIPIDLVILGDAANLYTGYFSQPSYVFKTKDAEAAILRMRNRGPFPGRGRVQLYRTPATPIAPPEAWEHVGEAEFRWVGPESLSHAVASSGLTAVAGMDDLSWVMVVLPWDSAEELAEIEALGDGIVEYQKYEDAIRFHNLEQTHLDRSPEEDGGYVSDPLQLRIHDFSKPGSTQAIEIRYDLPEDSRLELSSKGYLFEIDVDLGTFTLISGPTGPAPWSGIVSLVEPGLIRISEFELTSLDFVDWSIVARVPEIVDGGAPLEIVFDQYLLRASLPTTTRIGRMTFALTHGSSGPS